MLSGLCVLFVLYHLLFCSVTSQRPCLNWEVRKFLHNLRYKCLQCFFCAACQFPTKILCFYRRSHLCVKGESHIQRWISTHARNDAMWKLHIFPKFDWSLREIQWTTYPNSVLFIWNITCKIWFLKFYIYKQKARVDKSKSADWRFPYQNLILKKIEFFAM